MQKLKSVTFVAGWLLFIFAAAMICVSIKDRSAMLSADSYEDKGIYTFIPYQMLPVQVENTGANGRNRRMNPVRTVYMVYYKDNKGSGYQWKKQALTRENGLRIVEDGEPVKRRVLSIPGRGTYITVEPGQTAESYTAGQQKKNSFLLLASGGYLLFYVLIWCMLRKRRQ